MGKRRIGKEKGVRRRGEKKGEKSGRVRKGCEAGGEGQPVPDRLTVYLRLVGQQLGERMALCWESDEETVDSENE